MRYSTEELIQEINTSLQNIQRTRERYHSMRSTSTHTGYSTYFPVRAAPLFTGDVDTVGIEEPRNQLVSWALEPRQRLEVMFVVGMAGLGKTTLVNSVYERVKQHFDCHRADKVAQARNLRKFLHNKRLGGNFQIHLHKCDGLPLGIIEIGKLLSRKAQTAYEWDKLHNSLESELRSSGGLSNMMSALSASYEDCLTISRAEGNLTEKTRRLSIQKEGFDVPQMSPCPVFELFSVSVQCHYRSCAIEVFEFEEYKYKEHPLVPEARQSYAVEEARHCRTSKRTWGKLVQLNWEDAKSPFLNVTSLDKEEPLELDAMDPPRLLQRLYLKGPLQRFPRWVSSLHDLVRIRLKWSSLTEDNPIAALEDLPNLMELQLLDAYTGDQFDFNKGNFQKLKI
ncbi:Disease resistance protein RPM1 [Vitis vinifera]|uniref:Disease resistance protein RPM1 n=1 Tax=Vitis vinifera TaxID=29760 RepID=A0A438J1F5_VITVI|nr:Disease resistance protein RPM1 [Vitis vinifera]